MLQNKILFTKNRWYKIFFIHKNN